MRGVDDQDVDAGIDQCAGSVSVVRGADRRRGDRIVALGMNGDDGPQFRGGTSGSQWAPTLRAGSLR